LANIRRDRGGAVRCGQISDPGCYCQVRDIHNQEASGTRLIEPEHLLRRIGYRRLDDRPPCFSISQQKGAQCVGGVVAANPHYVEGLLGYQIEIVFEEYIHLGCQVFCIEELFKH
jgi:hypothetical protein